MDHEQLAARFEGSRSRLHSVAYRLLGSEGEADDAVQEAWIRLSKTDSESIDNLEGWLTTVVARVCLDMLRSRKARREDSMEAEERVIRDSADPEREAVLADSVGHAMVTVLDRLPPAERVAFVLHDVFSVSFDEIGEIVGRSPAATRQLASRGRRRAQGGQEETSTPDASRHRRVVEAFFRASRAGDFQALLNVLDPEVVVRPDRAALQIGMRTGWIGAELRGPQAVAGQFSGQAQAAQVAIIDGALGAVWAPGGNLRVAFGFTTDGDRVLEIELIADPETLAALEVEILSPE